MHSITVWNLAKPPNYNINVNKIYPYSEVPYIGQYNLVKIPLALNKLIELVDYWGEGRIISEAGISGFANCYNVNHQYQLVSNGPDSDTKIPNRVPVISYTNCDTRSYIKDNSVKIVTLMGAPINKSCAKDIARIVNIDVGKVVVFGFDNNSQDIKNLDEELKSKGLLYCYNYNLPDLLQGLTLFDNHRAYLNLTELRNMLYKNVIDAAYEHAVAISQTLDNSYNGVEIVDVVTKLLKNGIMNIMGYAFKLWHSGSKEIVINYFPLPFKLIFNEDKVKIIDKKHLLALKLDANTDYYNDRLAWGDATDKTSERVSWKFIPIWENNNVFFKIMNIEHTMFLKLDVNQDEYGDRKTWGDYDSDEVTFKWSLEPIKVDDDILFYIVNNHFNQGLKLDATPDSYGDRLLWGHNGSIYGHPEYFGWFIAPWD